MKNLTQFKIKVMLMKPSLDFKLYIKIIWMEFKIISSGG